MMHLVGSPRPLSDLDDLEVRRHRLAELVDEGLVSSTMGQHLAKAVAELDLRIAAARDAQWGAPMSIAA